MLYYVDCQQKKLIKTKNKKNYLSKNLIIFIFYDIINSYYAKVYFFKDKKCLK